MPYNLAIPGQVSEHQLKAIELVASLVPAGGKMVEVGSLFGSSSWAWAKSVDPSVAVFCIDPWEGNEGIRSMEARLGIVYGLEQFQKHTADCPNIHPLQGYSPVDFKDWADPIDLYYEDAVHTNPILTQNLDFWSQRLTRAGIICGDDYRPRFPDVMNGADALARRFGREIIRVDFFWCLLPSESLLPGAARVAAALKALGAESDALRRRRGPVLVAGPRQPIGEIPKGTAPTVKCRLHNDTLDAWPEKSGPPLQVGVRITSIEAPEHVLAEVRVPLPISHLSPDVPTDFDLVPPLADLPAGRYRMIFDVGTDGTNWMIAANPATAPATIVTVTGAYRAAQSSNKPELAGRACRLGEPIGFALGGQGDRFKGSGWVASERNHSWMLDSVSTLLLSPERTPGEMGRDLVLTMQVMPLIGGTISSQPFSIRVGGKELLSTELTKPQMISCIIPATLANADLLEISLLHPNAARPVDIDPRSQDRKLLSIAVQSITLSEAN